MTTSCRLPRLKGRPGGDDVRDELVVKERDRPRQGGRTYHDYDEETGRRSESQEGDGCHCQATAGPWRLVGQALLVVVVAVVLLLPLAGACGMCGLRFE